MVIRSGHRFALVASFFAGFIGIAASTGVGTVLN